MQNKSNKEMIAVCRRVLAMDSRDLGTLSVCKTFASELLERLLRRQESKSARIEFADYTYDAESAQQAWERN